MLLEPLFCPGNLKQCLDQQVYLYITKKDFWQGTVVALVLPCYLAAP